jgi:hypothetical protein
MAYFPPFPPFVQIACGSSKNSLFALDGEGGVWKYVPGNTDKSPKDRKPGEHYSFWSKLTDRRAK